MKSFLSEYIGRWTLSFMLTSLIAFTLQVKESSFVWIIAVGLSAITVIGFLFSKTIQNFHSHFLENLIPEDEYLRWWIGLSIGLGISMGGVYVNLTSIGFSIVLGLLSGIASFLFLIILCYEKD